MNENRPMYADDAKVIGYLQPRLISVHVAAIFGRRSFRFEVSGFQRRVHCIEPDPIKSETATVAAA